MSCYRSNDNRAVYIERCKYGSRRGLRKPATERRQGGSFLLHRTMSDIEAGSVSLESFVAEVAGMVKEIISEPLTVPAEIPGMEKREQRKETSGEIIEAPCPLCCGKKARRYEGKFGHYWRCLCSPVAFRDDNGNPAVREARTEMGCPVKNCKGKAVQFTSKKEGRLFWKCALCGNFFDDADGKPTIREKKEKK